MNEYEPATCNIGRGERRRRAVVSAVAFGAAVLYLWLCVVADVPTVLFGGVFVPLAIGFEWAIQAHAAFCVRLALLDRYDFRSDGGRLAKLPTRNPSGPTRPERRRSPSRRSCSQGSRLRSSWRYCDLCSHPRTTVTNARWTGGRLLSQSLARLWPRSSERVQSGTSERVACPLTLDV